MTTKYSQNNPTHKPMPWCKKPPFPPILPISGTPWFISASLRFYQCLPSGAPRDLSFFFHNIKLSAAGGGAATATIGTFTASLSVQLLATLKKFRANADLFGPSGPIAVLQTTTIDWNGARPVRIDMLHFANGIPPGQDGRLQAWE